MQLKLGFFALHGLPAAAIDPLSLLWQFLAALAVGGLLVVVIFAIIEPGPLVKKRPFPRKRRSTQRKAVQEDAPGLHEDSHGQSGELAGTDGRADEAA